MTDLARSLLFTSTSAVELREPENLAREAIRICRDDDDSATETADALCVLGWILNYRDVNVATTLDQNEGAAYCRQGLRIIEGHQDNQSLTIKGRLLVALSFESLRDAHELAISEARKAAEQGLQLLQLHRPHDRYMNLAFKAQGRCSLRYARI